MSAVRGGGICGSKIKRLRMERRPSLPTTRAPRIRTRRYNRELGLAAFHDEAATAAAAAAQGHEEEEEDASSDEDDGALTAWFALPAPASTPAPPSSASAPPPPTNMQSLEVGMTLASPSLSPAPSTSSSVEITWDSIEGEEKEREIEESKCSSSSSSSSSSSNNSSSSNINDDAPPALKDDLSHINPPPPPAAGAAGAATTASGVPPSLPAPVKQKRKRRTGPHVGLCLGMIRMTNEFMKGYKGCADPLLDLHAARDTRRMRVLENEMDMDIIALCDSREMEGVDHVQEATGKGKHINGLFENPPLRDVMRALRGRKISYVFGDYIRFPPQYAREAYRAVAKHLLVALRHSGLLAPECQVYLPYLKQHDGVENVFEGLMADRSLDPMLVSESENRLYRATRTLFDEEHLHKCEGLCPGTPFLRLTL